MRPVKLALLILLCTIPASAQWPYVPVVQSQSSSLNAASSTCVFPQNVTSGNIGLVAVGWETSTNTPSVSDTLTSSYTQKVFNTSNTQRVAVYTTTFGSSGANTVTVAITSAGFMNINCVEFPPNWTTTTDVSAVSTYSSTPATITTPSITTTLNSDLIYTFASNNNSAGFQGLQTGSFNTWYQVGSHGGADSIGGFFSVGGVAGAGNTVTLDNGGSLGTIVNIAFQSNSLAITSAAAAPDGDTLTAYNYTVLAAGGAGAYTWSVSAGALPTSLSINSSTGTITGTPTVSNNYSATIQVTDGTHTATKAISFKITTGLGTISVAQTKSIVSGSGTNSLAFTSNISSGNAILASANYTSGTGNINYCTDTANTSLQLVAAYPTKASSLQQATVNNILVFAGIAAGSGADTVQCGTNGQIAAIAEIANVSYTGNDNTLGSRGANASPATITSGSLTTLVPNELLFGVCIGNTQTSANTIDSPFTVVGTNTLPIATGTRIVTTVTGYTLSCDQASNSNTNWLIDLAGFRPGNGTVVPPNSGHGPKGKIL